MKNFGHIVLRPKKSSLVSGNRLGEKIFITHHPHSRMCIRIYIFNFKKQTNKQKNKQEYKKAKETKEERKKSLENRLKNKFAAARVKIFLANRIS